VMALGVTEAVKRRGGWSMIACRTLPTQKIEIALEAGYTPSDSQSLADSNGLSDAASPHHEGQAFSARYQLDVSTNSYSAPVIDRESLEITDPFGRRTAHYIISGGRVEQAVTTEPEWIGPFTQVAPLPTLQERSLLGIIAAPPIGDLWDGVRQMAFYNFLPAAMRPLQRPMLGQLLDQHGSNLSSVLADISKTEPWAFERIGRYLSAVVPQIERLAPVQYGEYQTTRFWLSPPKPDETLGFNADSMSDGTLRVLAALTAVFQNVPPYGYPSVVGIEEPESALHPAAMRALVAALDEATLRMQVLLTTHSPDLLDVEEVKPENVRVVQMIDGQTIIGPVDEASVEIVRRELNTLGGLERDNLLEPDLDDQDRQKHLGQARAEAPA